MNIDEILKEIGEFGSYQRSIYVLVRLVSIIDSFTAFITVFIVACESPPSG